MWPLERAWRLVATAVLYGVFGLGSVVLAVFVVIPLRVFLAGAPERRARAWRAVVRRAFAAFVALAGKLGVFTVTFHNVEGLAAPGQLIIANHPSLLDVVILMSVIDDVDCVVKRQLSRNPFAAWQVALADYVSNDNPEAVVAQCARRLDAGRRMIIFPEGTRTRRGRPLHFLRGTARTILATSAAVRPVLVHCTPHSLAKGDPWWHIPPTRIRYVIEVGEPLDVAEFRESAMPEPVRARRLTRWLEQWFSARLEPRPRPSQAARAAPPGGFAASGRANPGRSR